MNFQKDYKPKGQPIFSNAEDVGPRPWGKEELLVLVPGKYMLKKLTIKAGSKGGLQYHRLKDECGVLLSGKMIVRHENLKGAIVERVVLPGDCFHFPPGVVHQEEEIEDCIIIEGSTPHFNDRVRMEEYFGLGKPEGMPTTTASEIEEK
jgi:mannose-6-phosphate isomerase-like protein (cupin superfamily)